MPRATTTRETLLDAALGLLEERGPAAVRVRDVAAAAGQSTMGVYTHFGSKQALVEELYLLGFRRLGDALPAAGEDAGDRAGLLAFALAYRAFALENEALYGLMLERATPDFAPSDASRLAGLEHFTALVERVAAVAPGALDPAADAHLLWATMHGLVTIELTHIRWGGPLAAHLQADPEATYVAAVTRLVDALGRDRAPDRGAG